jgi:hypothetical protein
MNLGQQQQQHQQQQQQQANLAHLLQNPQFAHNLRQQAQQVQASQAASNPFSGAPYGYSNVRPPIPFALACSVGFNLRFRCLVMKWSWLEADRKRLDWVAVIVL